MTLAKLYTYAKILAGTIAIAGGLFFVDGFGSSSHTTSTTLLAVALLTTGAAGLLSFLSVDATLSS